MDLAHHHAPLIPDVERGFTAVDVLQPLLGGNYNALQAVTLQVTVDQSPPVTVAGLNPVPNGAQTLLLHLGDVNVLDLIKSSNVHFVFKVQLDGPLPAMSSHSLVLGAKVGVEMGL